MARPRYIGAVSAELKQMGTIVREAPAHSS
jgi:hypothetical protein